MAAVTARGRRWRRASSPRRASSSRRWWAAGARRLSWGIADQVVSTITNFAVSIFVARFLGATQFGAFSIAYVTYGFVLNASRGLASGPLMVRFTGASHRAWRRGIADSTGTAAVIGLAAGACVIGSAAFLDGSVRTDFLVLGLALPGLLLQDSWRYAFFALGRGKQALLNDLIWASLLLPAMGVLLATGRSSAPWPILAWGGAANVAAVAGILQAGIVPRPFRVGRWVSRHRDLGPRYLVAGTASAGASQLRAYGIGLLLGLSAVGYIQAANTLMGPFTVLFLGIALVSVPEGARVLRQAPERMPLFCMLVGGALALSALAWGLLLIVALPLGLGSWLLGPIWRPSYPLVVPVTLAAIAVGVGAGAGAGLTALGAARRSVRLTLLASALVVVCALAGAAKAGPAGSLDAAAVANWLCAPLWWWQLRAALREHGAEATGILPGRASRRAGRHRRPATPASRRIRESGEPQLRRPASSS